MNYKNIQKLILSLVLSGVLSVIYLGTANAECTPTYGGGETCIINKRFEIEKQVIKLDEDDLDNWKDIAEDSDDWEDKVVDVDDDEFVVFKIKIKNRSSEDAEDFDEMRMIDSLPDELERIGGSGLTEYWDDFESGDSRTFYIAVRIEDSEYDRDDDFEDCTVNKAKVEWDGNFEGSDTATVCWGEEVDEVTELPETGSNETIALLGLASIVSGFVIRKSLSYLS